MSGLDWRALFTLGDDEADALEAIVNGRLARAVIVEGEWPYGPPDHHESCCVLFEGAAYCDCKASDESDAEFGAAAWPTHTPERTL